MIVRSTNTIMHIQTAASNQAKPVKTSDSQALETMRSLPRKPNENLDHIPGPTGLPLIGCSLDMIKDAPDFMRRQFDNHGPVFKVNGFGSTSVSYTHLTLPTTPYV